MRVKADKLVGIELLTGCNEGVEPSYGNGAGKGRMSCPECHWCVGSVLYDENGRRIIGHFKTVCKCGIQINYSNAEKYI